MELSLREKQCFEYMAYAVEKIKSAGFAHAYTSMKSEASYYVHPARPEYSLRVAIHRYGRREAIGLPYNIPRSIASLSFSPGMYNNIPKSWECIDKRIEMAVGQYFLAQKVPGKIAKHHSTNKSENEK